jgi:hypothetical protein
MALPLPPMLSWVLGLFRWVYVVLFVLMLVWLQTRLFAVPAGSFAVVRRRWWWCWWRKQRDGALDAGRHFVLPVVTWVVKDAGGSALLLPTASAPRVRTVRKLRGVAQNGDGVVVDLQFDFSVSDPGAFLRACPNVQAWSASVDDALRRGVETACARFDPRVGGGGAGSVHDGVNNGALRETLLRRSNDAAAAAADGGVTIQNIRIVRLHSEVDMLDAREQRA